MHDMINSSLTEFDFIKKSFDAIKKDITQQMKEYLGDKLVGQRVEIQNADDPIVGIIRGIVIIIDMKVYVEIETNERLVKLSTEDLTFL